MVLSKRIVLASLALLLVAGRARAQAWGGGATIGVVNDVEHHFRWDGFHSKDIAGYLEYEIEKKVVVRATYGQMNVKGENAGQTFTLPSGEVRTMPDLTEDIKYATLGVSYEFFEGPFTSGMFAGIGGYKIEPDPVPEEIANYRDNRETSFGWHAGVDGSWQMLKHLNLVVRLTIHGILSTQGRYILSAGGGVTYRF
ncbi:MAG TPA: outer membrane beta-barrel protein [Thermoanaerobaculia bacterium]|nr:outer membrane beta-barrel protein [Thermoanaerobaculia bacterium]